MKRNAFYFRRISSLEKFSLYAYTWKEEKFRRLSGCRAGSSRSRVFFFVEKRRDREQGGEGLGEGERKRGRGGERERERRPSKAGEENERELVERVPW